MKNLSIRIKKVKTRDSMKSSQSDTEMAFLPITKYVSCQGFGTHVFGWYDNVKDGRKQQPHQKPLKSAKYRIKREVSEDARDSCGNIRRKDAKHLAKRFRDE